METSTNTSEQTSNGQAQNTLAVTLSYEQLRQLFGYSGDYEDFPAAVIDQLANEIEQVGHAIDGCDGMEAHMPTWRLAERARVAAEVISDYNAQQCKYLASASLRTLLAGVAPDKDLEDPKGLVSALLDLIYATDKKNRAAKFLRATWIHLLSNKSMDEWEELAKTPYVKEHRAEIEQEWAEERGAVAATDDAPQGESALPVASMRKAVALLQAHLPAEPAHDRCDNVEGALSTIEAWLAEDHQATLSAEGQNNG